MQDLKDFFEVLKRWDFCSNLLVSNLN
jgi:hypothetical protein